MRGLATPAAVEYRGDARLRSFLDGLGQFGGAELSLAYADGRRVGRGYHVTEVKAASFATLDCGGNPDRWQETVLQVEDLPPGEARPITAEKFRTILAQVAGRIDLSLDARVTFEVGPPGEPMQIFDVASLELADGVAVLHLVARAAICKPRHRAAEGEKACGPGSRCC